MPKTIEKTYEGKIIGGIFANEDDADKAVEAFEDLDISPDDIEVIVQLEGEQDEDAYTDLLSERGFSESQAIYYGEVIHAGKVLVIVSEVSDPAPIIDVFDKFKAEYNPNGSRNLRDDVAGMTVGTVVGAAAGGGGSGQRLQLHPPAQRAVQRGRRLERSRPDLAEVRGGVGCVADRRLGYWGGQERGRSRQPAGPPARHHRGP